MRLLRSLAVALPLVVIACGDPSTGGSSGGTVIIGSPADADALLPPLAGTVAGLTVSDLLFDRLAEIGPELNVNGDSGFMPHIAERWSWSDDSLAISFSINPDARWHDGTPVRAVDVVMGFNVIRDTLNGSQLIADIGGVDSVVAVDSLTAVVHFAERAAEQFLAATRITPLPAHLLRDLAPGTLRTSDEARAPVGSGRFRFVEWRPRQRLELAAVDGHYRGRPNIDRVVFSITPEPATGLARMWAGESDVWAPLAPNDVPTAEQYDHIRVYSGPGFDYGFLAFNFRDRRNDNRPHPLFAERELRRALTMAVDRDALREAIFGDAAMRSYGPFTRPQNTADTTITQIPFDRTAAAKTLDSLGWRVGDDGIRRRGAQRLAFGILIPTSSTVRNRASVLLQEQLRQVGVDVTIESMEFGAFYGRFTAGDFDATIGGWHTTPSPGGIRGTWGSPAISRGADQNAGHYLNPAFDQAVEAGLGSIDPAQRAAHLRRAYQIIVDDAAAIWLYEVRNHAAVHERFNIPSWRSDAWWLTLGDWTVDPDKRLPRDAAPRTGTDADSAAGTEAGAATEPAP
ncbi:MAG TPA: peptide ABC transporter substrate-binding protein [Gemmatimonadaceae bacterium]|nr:peptide ABC transporter substrate-binding protein [Gemmatimonadaceae bacterium]